MRKYSLLIGLFLFLSLNAFNQDIKSSARMEQLQLIQNEMNKAMVDGDHAAIYRFYLEDAISLPDNMPMLKGIEAIKKSGEMMHQMGVKISSMKTVVTEVYESSDLLVEIGTFDIVIEMQGMPQPYNEKGKYLNIWKKMDDGSLKLKVETWNSNENNQMKGANPAPQAKPEKPSTPSEGAVPSGAVVEPVKKNKPSASGKKSGARKPVDPQNPNNEIKK